MPFPNQPFPTTQTPFNPLNPDTWGFSSQQQMTPAQARAYAVLGLTGQIQAALGQPKVLPVAIPVSNPISVVPAVTTAVVPGATTAILPVAGVAPSPSPAPPTPPPSLFPEAAGHQGRSGVPRQALPSVAEVNRRLGLPRVPVEPGQSRSMPGGGGPMVQPQPAPPSAVPVHSPYPAVPGGGPIAGLPGYVNAADEARFGTLLGDAAERARQARLAYSVVTGVSYAGPLAALYIAYRGISANQEIKSGSGPQPEIELIIYRAQVAERNRVLGQTLPRTNYLDTGSSRQGDLSFLPLTPIAGPPFLRTFGSAVPVEAPNIASLAAPTGTTFRFPLPLVTDAPLKTLQRGEEIKRKMDGILDWKDP